jgi:hypothetical protein
METKENSNKIFWEDWVQEYEEYLKEVRKETFSSCPKEYKAIMECIHDAIDLYSRGKEEWEQAPHSFSGILRNYLFKLNCWISYEIISGKYFEAMRDIRFLYEGAILSVIIEDAIEGAILKKYGSAIIEKELKDEILDLWVIARYRKRIYKKRNKKRREAAEKIVEDYFQKMPLREMTKEEKKEYIRTYTDILSDERLGYGMKKMINETLKEMKENFRISIEEDLKTKFENLWRELSSFSHFTRFFKEISQDVPFIFVEKLNEKWFQQCFENYLLTLDLFYSVCLWRWPKIKERVKRLIELWEKDLDITFELSSIILKIPQK